MPPLGPLVLAAVLLAALPVAAGCLPDPTAPVTADAFLSGTNAIITWVPGAVSADTFNVYALVDGGRVLLESAPGTEMSAVVPAPSAIPCVQVDPDGPDVAVGCSDFEGYAVSAVTGGAESKATVAVLVVGVPCIGVDPDGPDVVVGCTGIGVLSKVRANLMFDVMTRAY